MKCKTIKTVLRSIMLVAILMGCKDFWHPEDSAGGSGDGSGVSHSPVITKFVVGIRLIDSDNGIPEKTVFNKGDEFHYGFTASDSKGDWKRMVHTIKNGGQSYDMSWDFTDKFIGAATIGTNGGYVLGNSGTHEMTWYILDQAGNKSNVITRTVTVN